MKTIKVRRVDLIFNGRPIGEDLSVDWDVEVDDQGSGTNGRERHVKFLNTDPRQTFVACVEPAGSLTCPTIRSGLRLTQESGLEVLLKTEAHLV